MLSPSQPQATTKNKLSPEDVLCSRTSMKILKTLKKCKRLNTTEIVKHIGLNFQVTASHLKLLEEQDVLRARFKFYLKIAMPY